MPVTTFDRSRLRDIQLLLESTHGHVAECAKALNVSRSTLDAWIRMTPELQETIEDIKQSIVDTLLVKLNFLATSNKVSPSINLAAIKEYLNGPAGRGRGWGATSEVNVNGVSEDKNPRDDMMRALIPSLTLAQKRILAQHDEAIHRDGAGTN